MDSLQATAASIRAAVSSPSTCTPATATILSDLLLPKSDGPYTTTTTNSKKPTISAAATKLKTGKTPVGGRKKIKVEVDIHEDDQLSLKERSILATEVINAALKSLSDAIKTPAPGPVRKQASSKDLIKASARKALRRSNSLPPSPLQPRSLNRVSSSPSISTRESRSSSSVSITSSGHRATGECARVAFACLRTLQASKTPGIDFSPLQLENGMSVMIGRLVSLGLDDLATKELRILKRRLDAEVPKKAIKSNVAAAAPTLAELLDFGNVQYTGTKLGLVVTTQLQVLRLMTNSRKPKQTEAALPILAAIHPSSPTRLLLLAAKESKEPKQIEKITRQLQALSEILLSLTPSVSPADDALALESRLSVAPMVAIQLQTLALHNRFLWWGLAGHKGDLSKELYDPFLRCLSTFARRSQSAATVTYSTAFSAFGDLHTLLSDCSDTAPRALMSVLVSIYRLLGSLAKEANNVEMAISWTEHVQRVMDPKVDSDAKRWSVLARLVSLKLRKPSNDPKDEELILNLLEGLESPFKGDSSEIDDLMNEVSSARRSAITLFTSETTALGRFTTGKLSHGLRQMCESLIFLCPRLCLRYLGNSPDINSATKDIVRHEQRRQFITKPAAHAIDSTLFLIRKLLSEEALTWELMDSKLQGCILLLDRLHEASVVPQLDDGYYVRISNLYFTQYLNLRRSLPQAKADTQVRALRRSIDCLRTRPSREKKAGQFSTKLEKLAEWCRATARHDELFKTLSTLRNEMIDAGALSTIAANAAFRPIWIVWTENDEASMLGRTIHYLLKLQIKHLKNISLGLLFEESWSIEERGAVLEHQLEILCSLHSESEVAEFLLLKVLRELVSIYDRRQYPIRRLRVLIRMLSEELDRKLRDEMKDDLRYTQIADLFIESTKDEGLRGYLTHFKTLAVTVMELQQNEPKIDVLTQSLETWISIRTQCKDMPALERQIDYVPGLLSYLHSIADYFQMKGLNTNRISALRLITEINELSIDDSCPDDLVLSFATLGSQWLQMGYSGKAGLSFDRAKNYNHRNGVTPYASLQLHLSYSEYLLSIGSLDKW
jgi:separase